MKKDEMYIPKVVGLAYEILGMQRELEILRDENMRLQGIEKKYHDLLDSSISHNQRMMFGVLDIAMTPGVIDAIGKHNAQKEKGEEHAG